jgi:hypothetical protein
MGDPAGDLERLLADTAARLDVAGVKDEALGVLRAPRGFSFFTRPEGMRPVGRAWRLGALLLTRDARLLATGEVTRAVEPGRAATNRSPAGQRRREIRLAASRGPFAEGEVVNFDFESISLDHESLRSGTQRVALLGDTLMVRWDDREPVPFDRYFADRVALLLGE